MNAHLYEEIDHLHQATERLNDRIAALEAENERLRTERYQLACAICGGEDAPGYLDSIDVETIAKVCRDNYRDWSSQTDKNIRLEAENAKLRAAARAVIYAEEDFISHMHPDWEKDPVAEAVDALRAAMDEQP